jgi:hypothetical protein
VKLLTFHVDDGRALGVTTDRGVVDLRHAREGVTPAGVILGRRDQTWLRAGDRIEIEIGSLGRLTTVMAGEAG